MKRKTLDLSSYMPKKIRIDETASNVSGFINQLQKNREKTAKSVLQFNFQNSRVRTLSKISEVKENCDSIIYWMSRDQRIQDNWALLFAQKLALQNRVALKIIFCLQPQFLDATIRHYDFLLNGLKKVSLECRKLNIDFNLLLGTASIEIPKILKSFNVGAIVCDMSPLRVPSKWVDDLKKKLPKDIPLFQVDAHNIVPVWETSDKQEFAARTIRNKVNNKLTQYLTEFPPLIKHPHASKHKQEPVNWKKAFDSLKVDVSVKPITWAQPGYEGGITMLQSFIKNRLKNYDQNRNKPTMDGLSKLSPWFHFGQISVQRAVLEVRKFRSKHPKDVESFCEEAIVRRELSDNFCFYNKNYDKIAGCPNWAKKTLNAHRKDKRPYIYTKKQLDSAVTHDNLWNAAQTQMKIEGKMHGFMRMYWAKKILEWTRSPEEALSFAIYLNDRYSIDGRDPNGYVGCMWSIGGVHDRPWGQRAIFGMVRYMSYDGCRGKFNINQYIDQYAVKTKKEK